MTHDGHEKRWHLDPSSGDGGGSDSTAMMTMLGSMMKTLCAKDQDDSYCALKSGSLASSMYGDQSSGAEPAPAEMCTFCGKKIMGASMSMIPDREERKMMAKTIPAGAATCCHSPWCPVLGGGRPEGEAV